MAKKSTKSGLDLKTFTNEWERQKAQLEAIALDSVKADAAVVETKRALDAATKAHDLAVKRKTAAEERLATVRANLGGE
jgi:hypothetical protein